METERSPLRLEVHLLDYQLGDFYGQRLEVQFEQFLREEQSFPDLDALKTQIGADARRARSLLES